MSFLYMVLLSAVLFVVGQLLMPKPEIQNAKPGNVDDFKFPTAQEDRAIPAVWGTNRITGANVIWYGDFRAVGLYTKVRTSFFGSSNQLVGHEYFAGLQFALCLGPLDAISEVRVGKKVIMESGLDGVPQTGLSNTRVPGLTSGNVHRIYEPYMHGGYKQGGGLNGAMVFYAGHDNPAFDPYVVGALERSTSPTNADILPGYAGLATIVLRGQGAGAAMNLGERTQIEAWDFTVHRYPNPLFLPEHQVRLNVELQNGGQGDCNAMNALYEILTDVDFGLGLSPADVDTPSFVAAAETLYGEGLGFSYLLQHTVEAKSIVEDILEHTNGVLFQDQQGLLTFKLIRNDYDVATLPVFTRDNIIKFKSLERGAWSDTNNTVHVKYVDWENDFIETVAPAHDMGNIQMQSGQQNQITKKYPGARTQRTAAVLAQRLLNEVGYPLVRMTFDVNRDGEFIKPGDVVLVTDLDYQIEDMPVRITEVNIGNAGNTNVTLSGVQDVYANPLYIHAPSGTNDREDSSPSTGVEPADISQVRGLTAYERTQITDESSTAPVRSFHEVTRGLDNNDQFKVARLNAGFGDYDYVTDYIGMTGVAVTALFQGDGRPVNTATGQPWRTGNPLVAESDTHLTVGLPSNSAYCQAPQYAAGAEHAKSWAVPFGDTDTDNVGDYAGLPFASDQRIFQHDISVGTHWVVGVDENLGQGVFTNHYDNWDRQYTDALGVSTPGEKPSFPGYVSTNGGAPPIGSGVWLCTKSGTFYPSHVAALTKTATGKLDGLGSQTALIFNEPEDASDPNAAWFRWLRDITTQPERLPLLGLASYSDGRSITNQSIEEIRSTGAGLCKVGEEFIAFTTMDTTPFDANGGGDGLDPSQTVQDVEQGGAQYNGDQSLAFAGLTGIYRGMFDTDIVDHTQEETVWFLSGAEKPIGTDELDENTAYTFKHITRGLGDVLDINLATPVTLPSSDLRRYQRPLRPSDVAVQGNHGALSHGVNTDFDDLVVTWVDQGTDALTVLTQDESGGSIDAANVQVLCSFYFFRNGGWLLWDSQTVVDGVGTVTALYADLRTAYGNQAAVPTPGSGTTTDIPCKVVLSKTDTSNPSDTQAALAQPERLFTAWAQDPI